MWKNFWEHGFSKAKPLSINYGLEMMGKVTGKGAKGRVKSYSATGTNIPTPGWELRVRCGPQTSETL